MRVMLQRNAYIGGTLYYRDGGAGTEIPDVVTSTNSQGETSERPVEFVKFTKNDKGENVKDMKQQAAARAGEVFLLPSDARPFDKPEPPRLGELLHNAGDRVETALSELNKGNKSLDVRPQAKRAALAGDDDEKKPGR